MKGVVFTEFLGMVEEQFSADMVDDVIDDAQLPHGGAYTAVGTYPHQEMVAMVVALSRHSHIAVSGPVHAFGKYLFGRFVVGFPSFFHGVDNAFQFLSSIENIIHVEVLKLYPDAELPSFDVEHHEEGKLVLLYHSPRHFEDLAECLMQGCVAHFGESIVISRQPTAHGSSHRFHLTRQG